jgi:hypothetical protein
MISDYIQQVYNQLIRPLLPKKIAVFNGIPVRGVRLFDATDTFPDYEGALITSIRSRVNRGDDVDLVGGGRGVSSVAAAQEVGPNGSVTTYEGSIERYKLSTETVELNLMDDIINVNHSIIGNAIDLAGTSGDAEVVSPADLPVCDILILDCEGAEIDILQSLDQRPETLIVETHGFLDSPADDVRTALDDIGYKAIDQKDEDQQMGVHVLTAVDKS